MELPEQRKQFPHQPEHARQIIIVVYPQRTTKMGGKAILTIEYNLISNIFIPGLITAACKARQQRHKQGSDTRE